MARSFETGKINKKPHVLDATLIARRLGGMSHLELGIMSKFAVAPQAENRPKENGRRKLEKDGLYVDGSLPMFTDSDVWTSVKNGGVREKRETYRDYLRVICLIEPAKKKGEPDSRMYVVDASHLELGANALIRDRLRPRDWSKVSHAEPLAVVDFIPNALELESARSALEAQYGLILPPNTLSLLGEVAVTGND